MKDTQFRLYHFLTGWSAELYMLRDGIDRAPEENQYPEVHVVGLKRFEISWKPFNSQVRIQVSDIGNPFIQTFWVNHNTTPLLNLEGKPILFDEPNVTQLPTDKSLRWLSDQSGELVSHIYPLVDFSDQTKSGCYLSDLAFQKMLITIFPWLE